MSFARLACFDLRACGIYLAINDALENGPPYIPRREAKLLAARFSRLMYEYGYSDYAPIKRKSRTK